MSLQYDSTPHCDLVVLLNNSLSIKLQAHSCTVMSAPDKSLYVLAHGLI